MTNTYKRYQKPIKPIEIKEPYKPEVLTFDTPVDFTDYYRKHEDEFRDMTTYKLNVKYKIPGYRITQSKKKHSENSEPELKLTKDYRNQSGEEIAALNHRLTELEAIVHQLQEAVFNQQQQGEDDEY